jgi:hypothetical protein
LKSTTQVPAPVKVTLPEAKEQPVELLANVLTTASPEVAAAPGEYEPPVLPAPGDLLTVMTLAEYTRMLCST